MRSSDKLSRFWARTCIVLMGIAIFLAILGALWDTKWLILVGILLTPIGYLIRLICLPCPCCGYRAAPPQWSKSGTIHCIKCGKAFEYDR